MGVDEIVGMKVQGVTPNISATYEQPASPFPATNIIAMKCRVSTRTIFAECRKLVFE